MEKPKNRKAEVLLSMIETYNSPNGFTYLSIARETGNNNVHRYRDWLQQEGLQLSSFEVRTQNRYGTEIKYKRFRLKSKREAVKLYKQINVNK